MNDHDLYPSTYDLPLMAGGSDEVLSVLQTARERLDAGWSSTTYLDRVRVCALGALIKAADPDLMFVGGPNRMRDFFAKAGEEHPVIEAMRLLNEKTLELYPDSKDWEESSGGWYGPLEWLNQTRMDSERIERYDHTPDERKMRVLKVYDAVIEDQKNMPPLLAA